MFHNLLWKIILGYVFIRPLISGITFDYLELAINCIFIISSCVYIYKYPFNVSSLDKIIFIFLLSLLLSFIFSINPVDGIIQLFKYASMVLLFYSIRFSGDKERRLLTYILLISGCIVSLYSLHILFVISNQISQVLPNHQQLTPFAEEFLSRNRAFSPFITPNLLANYLVMIIIFSLGLIFQEIQNHRSYVSQIHRSGPFHRQEAVAQNNDSEKNIALIFDHKISFFLCFACLSMCLVALYFTKSIGGWMTFILCAFLFFTLAHTGRMKMLFVICCIMIFFALMIAVRMKTNIDYTTPIFSFYKRGSYWKETLTIILQHPLRGVGLGNFTLKETIFAHNSYLQIWAEMGILAVISWLGIVFLFLKKAVFQLRSKEKIYYRLGVILSGVAFLIHNLFDFSFFISQSAFLWWILLGLIYQETAS